MFDFPRILQSCPCFHGNRLLSSRADWSHGWIDLYLLAIRSCVSCVPYLRLSSPPFRERRKRSFASWFLLATKFDSSGPALPVVPGFRCFSSIPCPLSGFSRGHVREPSIRVLQIALGFRYDHSCRSRVPPPRYFAFPSRPR